MTLEMAMAMETEHAGSGAVPVSRFTFLVSRFWQFMEINEMRKACGE
jgi:hypothetical protein